MGLKPLSGQEKSEIEKPNILCILVDDLGYGDLSCMGATDLLTPHIDKLAAEGMLMTSFYANCTVCSPSRASLLSGRYPDIAGVPGVIRQVPDNNWGFLDPELELLPSVLLRSGYQSAMIGKWHLGLESPNLPNEKGFDLFKGFLGDMMDDYYTHLRHGVNWMRHNDSIIEPEGHASDIFTGWTIEYLREKQSDDQPFFLYLAYNAPHFPIQPPADWLEKVKKREPGLEEPRARNVALVEHLDHCIGKVLSELEELGMAEHTLVVFSSDNGGSLAHAQSNGKLRGGKQDMFEGGIRVPTIFRWPGQIKPGSVSGNFGMLMDLFPSFCQIAGAEYDKSIDGISLLPALMGKEQHSDGRFVFWMRTEGGNYGGQAYYAARYGDFKLLQNSAYEPFQYFNIKDDPFELRPLNGNAGVFGELRAALRKHIQEAGAVPWQKKAN